MEDSEFEPEQYRERLLELCRDVESSREAGDDAAATVELDQQRLGRLSRMDALGAQAMSAAAQRRREAMLVRARKALARIDAGDYGHCRSCDEPIDPRRLDFDPTVEYCIRCAEHMEHD